MHSNSNSSRALTGYLKLSAIAYRKSLKTFALILSGIVAGLLVLSVMLATYSTSSGSSNGGAFSGGVLAAMITVIVIGFQSTSNREISRIFAFPMSRRVLALGNAIVTVCAAFAFTYVIAVIGAFEAVLGRFLSMIVPGLLFTSHSTWASYVVGFWISASYLVLFMSGAYALGMYFNRYKVATMAFFGLGLVAMFVFPTTFSHLLKGFEFFFLEPSPAILSLKIWVSGLVLHILAIFPLSRMEVKS